MSVSNSNSVQGFWKRTHHLDKMTFRDLLSAYFQHYSIIVYLGLALICATLAIFRFPATPLQMVGALVIANLVYPLVWYSLHRWVLHSQWMYKVPFLASTWKRIHYDHHQDPNHLEVLFGALHTTLPTILLATAPWGYLLGGIGGALMAFAGGLVMTAFYEFTHCIQHLAYKPRNKMLAMMKARHMAHHFHDEDGNFGITNFLWDRAFGTLYEVNERSKSPTVFNLGYTPEVAEHWPWVSRLSGGVVTGHPRQRHKK